MKTKLLKLLVLVAGFAAYTGFASDLVEILPCNEYGVTQVDANGNVIPQSQESAPLSAGETIYFKLRLGLTQEKMAAGAKPWRLVYNTDLFGSETTAVLMGNLPEIGLWTTGDSDPNRVAYAKLDYELTTPSEDGVFTDLVFAYTIQPGDYAMPIRLATNASGYIFRNVGKTNSRWLIQAPATATTYTADISKLMADWDVLPNTAYPPEAGRPEWISDPYLLAASYFVRTLDFGAEDGVTAGVWRTVSQGSKITLKRPVVQTTRPVSGNVKVYVWSANDAIVTVVGGVDTEVATGQRAMVRTLTIEDTQSTVEFDLEAVGTDGDATQLYLSATPHFNNNLYVSGTPRMKDYREVTVAVGPAPAPSVALEFASNTANVEATGDWTQKTQLNVVLSEARATEVKVTLLPELKAPVGQNINDYIAILDYENSGVSFPTAGEPGWIDVADPATYPTVTIPAGSKNGTLYVYAKNGGAVVKLDPETNDAGITLHPPFEFNTTSVAPVITAPVAGSQISAAVGVGYEMSVKITDAYTAYSGAYQIEFKENQNLGTEFRVLTDINDASLAFTIQNGELKDASGKRPTLMYTEDGTWQSTIRVTSSTGLSVETTFNAIVKGAPTATITSPDDAMGVYNEGQTVNFKVELSEKSNKQMYAYLLPNADATAGQLEPLGPKFILNPNGKNVKDDTKKGIPVSASATSFTGRFKVCDGAEDIGTFYSLEVVLTSGASYDPKEIIVYDSTWLDLQVLNVKPSVSSLRFDVTDTSTGDIVQNGSTLTDIIPKGQTKKIKPTFKDDGTFDLTKDFWCYWTASGDQGGSAQGEFKYPVEATDTTTADSFEVTFTAAGTWTIRLYVKDKDMVAEGEEYDFTNPAYTFMVKVTDRPEVLLDLADAYYEDTIKGATINVGLGYFPTGIAQSLVVKLTVANPDNANAAQGSLTLSTGYVNGFNVSQTPPANYTEEDDNIYYITFTSMPKDSVKIPIATMDGTIASSTSGFKVTAEVVGSELGPDGTYPGVIDPDTNTDYLWRKYYQKANAAAFVENVDPICTAPESNTNAWNVAAVATSNPITFMIRSDVTADMDAGIQVTITGCQSGTMKDALPNDPATGGNPQTNPMDFKVYAAETFTFTPNFGTAQGEQTVYLTIADKDGVGQTWKYLYNVSASKFLYTRVSGPAGAFAGSNLSQYYHSADGLGQGHVTVNGATNYPELDSAGFNYRWDCGKALEVDVTASGFKAGVDTKTYMQANGGAVAGLTGDFTYADSEHDSFFYTWLMHIQGENGTYTSNSMGLAPEQPGSATSGDTGIPLPKEATDGSYANTRAEAIFAKEFRPLDNCGDINGDGIPDLRVVKYWPEIVADGKADLADLSALNEDEDFLPAGSSGGNDITPNVGDNWSGQGGSFNAYLEIRGHHPGLNAGYQVNGVDVDPDPDYSVNEKRAYLLWKGIETLANLQGMADADVDTLFTAHLPEARADLARANDGHDGANTGSAADGHGWSPERPTDPTKADTDNDGLPDGYEYWFWYAAKVGYSRNNTDGVPVWQGPLTGRRLTLENLATSTEIHPEDSEAATGILTLFDPLRNSAGEGNAATQGSVRSRDTDNDGLTDWEELLMGTNPLDYDTDSGGASDGYEVMWGLNPLDNVDENGLSPNPDGDFVAWAQNPSLADGRTPDPTQAVLHIVEYVAEDAAGVNTRYCYLIAADEPLGMLTYEGVRLATKTTDVDTPFALADYAVSFGDVFIPNPATFVEPQAFTIPVSLVNVTREAAPVNFALVHEQVYTFFGFDPRTGWASSCPSCAASVTGARWCGIHSHENSLILGQMREAGSIVNTRAFTTREEYFYGTYRRLAGRWVSATPNTVLNNLRRNCTNPNGAFENKVYGSSETSYTSGQHGADTNGNGVPDGWEIYMGADPIATLPNWAGGDADDDGLSNGQEFLSVDSLTTYAHCPTIANMAESWLAHHWLNKFFPTDANNDDTDGDGIVDEVEGSVGVQFTFFYNNTGTSSTRTFIYGELPDDVTLCIRGGGLNPCSIDTDFDGLPDGWEWQFAGIKASTAGSLYTAELQVADGFAPGTAVTNATDYIIGGMDGTDSYDTYTSDTIVDKITSTVRDRDFDHDGLENYQEYLTQAVRMWRYDDAETPLNGRAIIWPNVDLLDGGITAETSPRLSARDVSLPKMNVFDGAAYYEDVQGSAFWTTYATTDNAYATLLAEDRAYDYRVLGYFAPCRYAWDAGGMQIDPNTTDPLNPILRRFMMPPQAMQALMADEISRQEGLSLYVSTDPRQWDSDMDGMDDYWEIFHGLNPLYGGENGADLVAAHYDNAITAMDNIWTGGPGEVLYPDSPIAAELAGRSLDPLLHPWLLGTPAADPDGDGLRNADEAIVGNMTDPTPYHTDPSPAWMTDHTSDLSFVSQYYPLAEGVFFGSLDPIGYAPTFTYMFAFEENEGYDTDGDWRGDTQESTKKLMALSDPLDSSDPDRRAALYFPAGDTACATSFIESNLPDGASERYDVFRQFTVECWVRPDTFTDTGMRTLVERGFAYPISNYENSAEGYQWRANFRLELDAEGAIHGLFDNSNPVETGTGDYTARVVGSKLAPGKWSHVALTFDGAVLALYVDGIYAASIQTKLIPANGMLIGLQDPGDSDYPFATCVALNGAITLGARRATETFDWANGFDQFTAYYPGYISEVRFWDGARTATEIENNYKRRLTQADIADNRETVFTRWDEGATRNNNDGKETLPAQLLALYNFQQLPAAVEAGDVALVPSGFHEVQANCTAAWDEAEIGWWTRASQLHSQVYDDYHVVPWVQNMVTRLPMLDQTFHDSVFWSNWAAGYRPASLHGLSSYEIPNGGNPYKARIANNESMLHRWRLSRFELIFDAAEVTNIVERSRFEQISHLNGRDDLVPLGEAYAKLCPDYWDDQGATTTWVDTGADSDGDGLPDWWELLFAPNTTTGVDVNGLVDYTMKDATGKDVTLQIPAWEAYLRDLAAGLQPDGMPDETYASTADGDGDGLVDWWQSLHGVKGGANGDDDGDGLPNYVEYLLSEYFKLNRRFSPVAAYSVNEHVSDYFYPVGKSYVGAIFTDHDFIADAWEDRYAKAFVSRYLYDALADADGTAHLGDGWSNFAEFQAGTDPRDASSLGVDGVTMSEYPVPMVEATLVYLGDRAIANVPVVVKAWREATPSTKPDAVWTIGSAEENKSGEGNSTSNVVQGVKHLGMNPGKTLMFHLSPGNVVPGSVKFFMKDTDYTLLDTQTYQRYYSESKYAIWADSIVDKQSSESLESGVLMYQVRDRAIGTINYETGAVTIDLSGLEESSVLAYDITATGSTASGNIITLYNHMKSYVKVEWQAKANAVGASATYYLADADEPSETNNSSGHLCEGKNTFVAFWDIDGNGHYTAGEPYGVARNVDVGWNKAKVYIEMTDTSPVTARFSVEKSETSGEAPNDRTTLWGKDSSNVDVTTFPVGQRSEGLQERVRIVRTGINDMALSTLGIPARIVLDKEVVLANDSYITEADIFAYNNQLDIDWQYLSGDLTTAFAGLGKTIEESPVTNITYHIVLGDAPESAVLSAAYNGPSVATNNYLNLAFRHKFDAGQDYMNIVKPVPVGAGECLTPSPTFSWVIPKGLGTYTAFILKLMDENGTEIWDSGFQPMPPRKKLSEAVAESSWRYDWTAPIYAGALLPGSTNRVFENGKQYQWKVAVVNSLYKNNPNYSEARAFTMNVQEHSADYGTIHVGVRYFGPVGEKVLDQTYPIRVQAFATPDFSGVPVSEGYVTDVTSVTDQAKVITTANAKLIGLEQGTYYVRAFIDTETDGQRANWESWGYVCTRDVPGGNIFTPQSIVIGSTSGPGEIFPIYIEDCDTEQDSLPDAWEWSQKGNLTDLTVTSTTLLANGVMLNEAWAEALKTGSGTLSDGLAARLTAAVNSPYAAAMVMGVDVSDTESADDVLTVLKDAPPETTVEAKTVSFTTVDFDLENNQVKLVAETDLASKGASTASSIYTFTATDTLTLRMTLLAKETLDQTAWTIVETKEIEVSLANPTIDQTIDLGNQVAPGNGFFKITLEEIQ